MRLKSARRIAHIYCRFAMVVLPRIPYYAQCIVA